MVIKLISLIFIIATSLFGNLFPSLFGHSAPDAYIVVPGTWAQSARWHKQGGDFFDSLCKTTQADVITFEWSGNNNHASRVNAAHELAALIDSYNNVVLIAHSHGSNVCILASQILGKKKSQSKIYILYAMATPIDRHDYTPDMNVIQYLYNLFSFKDMVQPIFGAFSRVFEPHPRIANIRVTINGREPGHSKIHDPLVGQWLFQLHDYLHQQAEFAFSKPGILHFIEEEPPVYEIDEERDFELEVDSRLQHEYAHAFSRSRNTKKRRR